MNQTKTAATRERARQFLRDDLLDTGLESQHLSVAIYRGLAAGSPITKRELAGILEYSPAQIETLLAAYTPSIIDFDADGAIVAFAGLSLSETAHEFQTAGLKLYTWCVLDALFLPEIIGGPAVLRTDCAMSGDGLEVRLDPKRIVSHRPGGIVMSIVGPDRQACQDNIRGAFCQHVLLFRGDAEFRQWARNRGDVAAVPLEEAHALGAERNASKFPDIEF